MNEQRLQEIVKRQRRQLASIGWAMLALGAFCLLLAAGTAISGGTNDTMTLRALLIGAFTSGGGVVTLWRSRRQSA